MQFAKQQEAGSRAGADALMDAADGARDGLRARRGQSDDVRGDEQTGPVSLETGGHMTRAGLVRAALDVMGQWSEADEALLTSAEAFGERARASGLLQGDGETGALRLADPVTRAEAALIVSRAFGLPTLDAGRVKAAFSDLSPTHWAAAAVYGAALIGVITGLPGALFAPGAFLLVEHGLKLVEKARNPPGEPVHDPTGEKPGKTKTPAAPSEALDTLTAALVEQAPGSMREQARSALPPILRNCLDTGVHDSAQVAYILATAQHESGMGGSMVEKRNAFYQQGDGSWSATVHTNRKTVTAADQDSLETAYWDSAYGHKLGNRQGTTDGRNYRGRGFVQLTGRVNYETWTAKLVEEGFSYTHGDVTYGAGPGQTPIDLLAHPEHVNEVPELAARILVQGSKEGTFTGKGLDDYINDDGTDFTQARRVINGDVNTNGASIAKIAEGYQAVLDADGAWQAVIAEHGAAAAGDEAP